MCLYCGNMKLSCKTAVAVDHGKHCIENPQLCYNPRNFRKWLVLYTNQKITKCNSLLISSVRTDKLQQFMFVWILCMCTRGMQVQSRMNPQYCASWWSKDDLLSFWALYGLSGNSKLDRHDWVYLRWEGSFCTIQLKGSHRHLYLECWVGLMVTWRLSHYASNKITMAAQFLQ